MIVNLPFLIFAIILLWFPRRWMRMGFSVWNRRKRRSEESDRREEEPWKAHESGNPAVRFGAEFSKLRNYVDLLRAAAASLALFGGFEIEASLQAPPGATVAMRNQVLAIKIAILLVGLVIQTVRNERQRLLFFAPIFYLFGLSAGLCDLRGAGFAFALIWAINPMLKNPQAFLTVYAFALGAFGMFFTKIGDPLAITAVLFCFLPVLLSLLAQRPLVLFTRKGTRSAGEGT